MSGDDPKPNADALIMAGAFAKFARAEGFEPIDVDFDVLGGIGLHYSWPAGHPDGEAERWAWIAAMNTTTVTCVMHARDGAKASFTVDMMRPHTSGVIRMVRFLRHGELNLPPREVEAAVLERVKAAGADGLRPSDVAVPGVPDGDVRSASLALASRGDVVVGDDWRMRPRAAREPDAYGLYHDPAHADVPGGRAARSVKVRPTGG